MNLIALLLLLQDPVKIDDHLAWVPQTAFERLKDPKNVPEELRALFTREKPVLVLVRGRTSEIIQPDLRGKDLKRRISFLPLEIKRQSLAIADDSFAAVKPPCVSEMLRCWPRWDDAFPILALQDGFFVSDDEEALPDSLIAAAADARVKNVALVALRNVFRRDAVDALRLAAPVSDIAKASLEHLLGSKDPGDDLNAALEARAKIVLAPMTGFEPLVGLFDPDADAKILKYLDHEDPRVRRDALDLAWAKELVGAAGRAEKLLSDEEAPVRLSAIGVLARLRRPEGVIAALFDDPSPLVRRRVVSLLNGKFEKVVALVADADLTVRYEAIDYCARVGLGRDALAERLKAELEPEERVYVASTLLARFNDESAAKPLAELLEGDLPAESRFDAIYALNRLKSPDAFAKLYKAETLEGENIRDLLKSFGEKTGLRVEYIDPPPDHSPFRVVGPPRLFGRLCPLDFDLEVHFSVTESAFVLDGDRIVFDSLDACADAMLKWWKTR